jgi:hypothetical protein
MGGVLEMSLSEEKIKELWRSRKNTGYLWLDDLAFARSIEAAAREEQEEYCKAYAEEWQETIKEQAGEIAKLRHDVDKYKLAFLDWSDKTEWVQQDAHNLFDFALGMHRADAMRKLIEKLREANAELLEGLATYKKHLMHCDRLDYHDSGRSECTCGLEALIAKHGGKEE